MTDDTHTTANRRTVLRLGGGVLLAGLAGCTGGGAGGDAPTGTEEMDDAEMDAGTTESGMDDETMTDEGGAMDGPSTARFRVRIENVSTGSTLQTMDGSTAVPLSPGAFVVHTDPGLLFERGAPASEGLERIAEDGMPGTLVTALDAKMAEEDMMADDEMTGDEMADDEMTGDEMTDDEMTGDEMTGDGEGMTLPTHGAFDTPVGADGPGPLTPGDAYEFEVAGGSDARLSFATMFIQSNDLFYAPSPAGIALWADGEPVSGSVTDQVQLWDAGTEVNEEPGTGVNQAPRQSGANTGTAENGTVRLVSEVDDGFTYPATADVIEVTVTPLESDSMT